MTHGGLEPNASLVSGRKDCDERRKSLADLKREVGGRRADELGKLVVSREVVDVL